MSGFAAITAANGWLVAALGISVVFFGLASLALIISYFPRVIGWWSGLSARPVVLWLKGIGKGQKRVKSTSTDSRANLTEVGDLKDAEEDLRLLTAHMGEPFKLPRLLELAEKRGLAKPYSTINRLLLRGTMVGGDDGLFRWASGKEGKGSLRSSKSQE